MKCFLTISPVALLPLLTGKVYRKQSGDGMWVRIKSFSKIIYVFPSLWLMAYVIYHYSDPAAAQSAKNIRIDAANLSDCLQKGTDWIRNGYDLNAVNQYCGYRYELYAFCKERPLTPQEVRNVVMSIIMVPHEVGPPVALLFIFAPGPARGRAPFPESTAAL